MGKASLHADHSASEHTAEAVGVEAGAEHGLNLVLENRGDLITAEVGHCDGVVSSEAKAREGNLNPGNGLGGQCMSDIKVDSA